MNLSTRREITALRLAAQGIALGGERPAPAEPADVVRRMLAMQAQDFGGAKWSIGLRLPGSTDASVAAALAAGEIVRSWPMRGTLHVVAPEDVGWMLDIARVRQKTGAAKRRADLGITDAELALAGEVAHREMTGGRGIRRDRLLGAWQSAGIPTTGARAYHLLWNLGHAGLIVFGPVDGKQPTFVLLNEWVQRPKRISGDEALAEFASRYFASHGPATDRDFAWWASLTLGDARRGIAAATGICSRDFDGITYYLAEGLEPAAAGIHALPGFDEYLLGYQDRAAPLAAEYSQRIVPGNNGVFLPTLVVDGEVLGTWKRSESARQLAIELIPFGTLATISRTGFERAMRRYEEFMALPVVLA